MNRHTPQYPTSRRARPSRRRLGMTLTEVLMALMVMGIGLVSVITLFPLSILRSVEATKLTNATATRINAEAKIKASVSRGVTSTGGLEVINSAILNDPDRDGNVVTPHRNQNFIFDPLGATIGISDGRLPAMQASPGDPNNPYYNYTVFGDGPVSGTTYLRRYTFGLNTQGAAQEFVTSPDSFITLFDGIAGSAASEHRTFVPPVANATQLNFYGFPFDEYTSRRVQVTLFGSTANGESTMAVLPGFTTANNLVEFKRSATDPVPRTIPTRFASLERVTVDLPEDRYSWIATVRNKGATPSVSVAVFFRRSFSPEDEKIIDLMKMAGQHTYFVQGLNPDALPPGLKQGGWMLDLDSFRWWKIAQLKRDNARNGYWIATDSEEYDPGTSSNKPIKAVFPGNIVEVYNLKKG